MAECPTIMLPPTSSLSLQSTLPIESRPDLVTVQSPAKCSFQSAGPIQAVYKTPGGCRKASVTLQVQALSPLQTNSVVVHLKYKLNQNRL